VAQALAERDAAVKRGDRSAGEAEDLRIALALEKRRASEAVSR
jgi:hypothetical protein